MPSDGANEPIYSVGEVINQVNGVLKERFPPLWVTGEVSNFKDIRHWYFDIVDGNSSLHCCMWQSSNRKVPFQVKNGDKVNLHVRLEVYAARGSFSAIVTEMELAGEGQLRAEYERLKAQLESEGLFMKRAPLPKYPKRIAVITGSTAAAWEDVQTNIARRYPLVELCLIPSLVQGANAPPALVEAIELVSSNAQLFDVLLLTRGGGSFEDLNAFNHESVARAIFECPIPVVSAIGHEIDFTICDFVADLRVPTPSTAAEELTPNVQDLVSAISSFEYTLTSRLRTNLDGLDRHFNSLRARIRNPEQLLQLKSMDLSRSIQQLQICMRDSLNEFTNEFNAYQRRLEQVAPQNRLNLLTQKLDGLLHRLAVCEPSKFLDTLEDRVQQASARSFEAIRGNLESQLKRVVESSERLRVQSPSAYIQALQRDCDRLSASLARLKSEVIKRASDLLAQPVNRMEAVSPLKTLGRGYAIVSKPDKSMALGRPIHRIKEINVGETVIGLLSDGSFEANVKSVDPTPPNQKVTQKND